MSKRILHALFYSIVKLNSIPVNVTSCFSHVLWCVFKYGTLHDCLNFVFNILITQY